MQSVCFLLVRSPPFPLLPSPWLPLSLLALCTLIISVYSVTDIIASSRDGQEGGVHERIKFRGERIRGKNARRWGKPGGGPTKGVLVLPPQQAQTSVGR